MGGLGILNMLNSKERLKKAQHRLEEECKAGLHQEGTFAILDTKSVVLYFYLSVILFIYLFIHSFIFEAGSFCYVVLAVLELGL